MVADRHQVVSTYTGDGPTDWLSSISEREERRVMRGSRDTRPPPGKGTGRGVEGESGSSAGTVQALTPPTSEHGPISVPPLTNQIRTSSIPEEQGVVSQRTPRGGSPCGEGQILLPPKVRH